MLDPIFYDRNGQPIPFETWATMRQDDSILRVQSTEVGPILVSTVWIGIDHDWSRIGPPLIFETLAFLPSGEAIVQTLERYPTEASAVAGHDQVCAMVRDAMPDDVEVEPGTTIGRGPKDE